MRRTFRLCALLCVTFVLAARPARADVITFTGSAGRISSQTNINNCAAGTDWNIGGVMCAQGKIATAKNENGTNVKTSSGELDVLTSGPAVSSSWTGNIYTAVWGTGGAMQIIGETTSVKPSAILLAGTLSGAEFVADCSKGASDCVGTLTFDYTTTLINQAFWKDLGYAGTPETLTGTVSLTAMKVKINSPGTIGGLSGFTVHSTSFDTTVIANELPGEPPPPVIPEPSSMILFGTGLASLLGATRRKLRL